MSEQVSEVGRYTWRVLAASSTLRWGRRGRVGRPGEQEALQGIGMDSPQFPTVWGLGNVPGGVTGHVNGSGLPAWPC